MDLPSKIRLAEYAAGKRGLVVNEILLRIGASIGGNQPRNKLVVSVHIGRCEICCKRLLVVASGPLGRIGNCMCHHKRVRAATSTIYLHGEPSHILVY